MKIETIIKTLVLGAIRMLDENGWNPAHGGEYQNPHVDIKVVFHKPSRFCLKAGYSVYHHEYGKWSGYLNGASHKNVGKPMLIADIETIKRREEINKDPEKFILDALSK